MSDYQKKRTLQNPHLTKLTPSEHTEGNGETLTFGILLWSRETLLSSLACVHKPLCLNAAFLQVHYSLDISSGLMEKLLLDTQNGSCCQSPWVIKTASNKCVCLSETVCAYT